MRFARRLVSASVLTFCLSISGLSITWFPKEFTCPIDNEKNTFLVVGSYGSYIYSYPSKYQWLFFPVTDSPTYYICKKCHLATYMWDFDEIPKDKIPELKKILANVKVSKPFKDKEYTELPVTERMEIMAKVYSVLGKDDDWWENFYRIEGYHYGASGDASRAAAARKKSLEFIAKFLSEQNSKRPKKLLLYTSAAMKHFLGDDKGALEDLTLALKTKYEEKGESVSDVKNAETGLNERINDYIAKIKSDKQKPRLFDTGGGDDH